MDFGQISNDFLSFADPVPIIRAILAFILVFFLPGFAWTLVFFKKVNNIERTALSFGLSIALVVLSVIALNVAFGVDINGTNALITIIVITVIPLAIYSVRRYVNRHSKAANGD